MEILLLIPISIASTAVFLFSIWKLGDALEFYGEKLEIKKKKKLQKFKERMEDKND